MATKHRSTLSKVLFRASRFNIEEVHQHLDDGSSCARQVVRHPGAVVILPILNDGRVCLIHSFRVAVQEWLLELPAGTLEPPIPPQEQAFRELHEETGYRAEKMTHVHTFCMSPGILDEQMHFYVATGLVEGRPEREVGEQIDNRVFSWEEIDHLIRDGKIKDAKTLVALLWYLRYRAHA